MVFCTDLANTKLLAASLGASAGVMLYVSFAEVFTGKAVSAFNEHYNGQEGAEGKAMRSATYCFFAGIILIAMLNALVHFLEALAGRLSLGHADRKKPKALDAASGAGADVEQTIGAGVDGLAEEDKTSASEDGEIPVPQNVQDIMACDHHEGLAKMGVLTGVAIALHNFPEGLATFIGTLAEPRAGIALAIAIALHNIPEGVCVAMPVYYATGSKFKGFFWSFLSGVTEPLGGLLGYFILWKTVTPMAYAILFGLVAGMMVFISLRELIPTALKYDPEDRVTTIAMFSGMVIMAASLLVFTA
eukprot:CAMPEP_0177588042 /NCGR_PEP_ID=MMETSP0419_2-20121207/6003_1 /TAXON_ID=582737 /ORGANISM="Tetraselmis sp., Strain GSL018" /LENGTH=302 /DNA_ID=CAMNT_0019078191 /DNA_START=891 /DNA_END=1799 /DNA_ORIENTATION=+